MPIFSFQCIKCGLSFKKRTKVTTVKCDCGEDVSTQNKNISLGFTSNVDGVKAQDTGMESLDLNYDRVIGEDAKQKWDMIYQRRKDKWNLLNEHENITGHDLLRSDDGKYIVNPNASHSLKNQRDFGMEKIKEIKNNNLNHKEK
jgi:hypothetical protein